jgi:hypothetical protein
MHNKMYARFETNCLIELAFRSKEYVPTADYLVVAITIKGTCSSRRRRELLETRVPTLRWCSKADPARKGLPNPSAPEARFDL